MKRIVAVFILLFFGNSYAIRAQHTETVDSLKSVLNTLEGIERYDLLIGLARNYAGSDYAKALEVAKEAYAISLDHGDSARTVESGRICGQLLNYLNRSHEAVEILSSVRPLARSRYREEHKKILNNLAIAYTSRAEYDKALDIHLQVLALNEEDGDQEGLTVTLTNIGHAYYRMHNYNEALVHFKKALERDVAGRDPLDFQLLLMNVGFCYVQMEKADEAKDYFEQTLDMCKGECRPDIRISTEHGLGIVSFKLEEYQVAENYFRSSLAHATAEMHQKSVSENLLWLARIKIKNGGLDSALEDLFRAESMASQLGYRELLISTYRELADIYNLKEDYKNYATYLRRYVDLKDSVYDEQVMDNLVKAKADYAQRENLAIIKAREMTIAQQQRFNVSVMIIAVLAGALVVVLFRNNKSMKRVNVELSRAKDLIYEQNKELEIRNKELDRLVEKKTEELKLVNLSLKEVNDELNTFIYRTAQDIRGPLATLKGMCYVAMLDVKDEVSLQYVTKINDTTDNLQTILRRLLIINSINSSKINPTLINMHTLVDNAVASQRRKGLPKNLVFRKNIAEDVVIQCDQELLGIVLENSIENAVKFCHGSWGSEHFVEVVVMAGRNDRVNIRVINNGIITSEYNSDDLYEVFLDSMFAEPSETVRHDLYFVKTAAKRIGAKVEHRKTVEGYNELTVVL